MLRNNGKFCQNSSQVTFKFHIARCLVIVNYSETGLIVWLVVG